MPGKPTTKKAFCQPNSCADPASDAIAKCSSQRQGQVVHSHRSPALLLGEQVGDQGRRDHSIARLSHTQQRPPEEHMIEIERERGAHGGQAPQSHAARQEHPPVIAVSQHAHHGRDQRVNHHEGDAQHAVPEIVDVELLLDLRADREERIAVDIVQQVHAEQDREREISAADGGDDAGFGCAGNRRIRAGRRHFEGASPGMSHRAETIIYTR